MYIHLGNNYIISAQDVVAILNMNTNLSEDLMDIIELARLDKKLVNISEEGKEKALVVCKDKVYLSPISSVTLFKRGAAL
ncbi:MAG: extracellular matrix/biofilm biosynthesis regulator RemA family protein [Syntrophomonadaceae bacterium]